MKLDSHHSRYRQADVSCSPPQLVLLLTDSAIRYCREAAEHLEAGRWAEKGQAVDAALACLSELRCGLDLENGGEIARQLYRNYDFLSTKLTIGNAGRDSRQFLQIADSLTTIRKAWQDLFDRLRAEGKLREPEGAADTLLSR